MFKKFWTLFPILFLPFLVFAQGHTTISANTPRLVVGIVIEDFNPDYVVRFWDKFGEGGFQRLYRAGFICGNHHYGNLIQRPSVNMATLSTGTSPSHHGIISDNWINRLKNKEAKTNG